MSNFVIGLIFLIIIVGISSYFRRKKKNTVVNGDVADSSRSGVRGRFARLMDAVLGRPPKKTSREFQVWAKDLDPLGSPPMSEFKEWLAALEPEEVQTLMNQVAAFGSPFEFNLVWLLDEQLDNNTQLKQTLEETVALYCMAKFKIDLVADDIQAFVALQAWEKNPNNKKQHKFNQDLFTKLVDEGLTPPAPPNLFLASDKRRQKHAVAAIQEVAKENPDAFNAALKDVVMSDKKPATAAQPQPAAVTV